MNFLENNDFNIQDEYEDIILNIEDCTEINDDDDDIIYIPSKKDKEIEEMKEIEEIEELNEPEPIALLKPTINPIKKNDDDMGEIFNIKNNIENIEMFKNTNNIQPIQIINDIEIYDSTNNTIYYDGYYKYENAEVPPLIYIDNDETDNAYRNDYDNENENENDNGYENVKEYMFLSQIKEYHIRKLVRKHMDKTITKEKIRQAFDTIINYGKKRNIKLTYITVEKIYKIYRDKHFNKLESALNYFIRTNKKSS